MTEPARVGGIKATLPGEVVLPDGVDADWFVTIDSTNEEAKRQAEAGIAGPKWIVAETQTAGRGRRGRVWASPTGNFAGTYLLKPDAKVGHAAELCFATALAVHDAVAICVPEAQPVLALKWPNDLLVDRAKLSGILLETATGGGGQLSWLAIGIGVNLAHHPDDTPYPATDLLSRFGVQPSQAVFLSALAASLEQWIEEWRRRGFEGLRPAWLSRAAGLNEGILVRLSDRTLEGRFEGLTPSGELVLRDAVGAVHHITAGDVFF